VKRNLHKSRLIEQFTRSRWSQSHTNNVFFKLVEALLQTNSCFFSHSIKLHVAYHYQQCHSLAALPTKMIVINSHMQDSHSVISNKPDCTPKTTYSYNKKTESLCYEQKHTSVLIWIETTIEYWFNYSSSSKFFSAAQILTFERPFCCSKRFHNAGNIQARTQGEMQGMHPPTWPKKMLRCWHDTLFHWKSSPKIFLCCTLLAKDAKN